jgi:hypothetical protein
MNCANFKQPNIRSTTGNEYQVVVARKQYIKQVNRAKYTENTQEEAEEIQHGGNGSNILNKREQQHRYTNRKAEIAYNTYLIKDTNITWCVLQINQTRY